MIDVRKLRLLRELHARGTVAAVAEALAYTPSAVSQGLAALVREAGVALTERVGRRLRLTDAGLRLVEHADALLARLEEAEADLQAAAGTVRGVLRVSSLQTPLLSILPAAVAALEAAHPELRLELGEAEPETALPAVVLGELDVAIAESYDHDPRRWPAEVARDELCRDRVVVALPAAHPLAAAGRRVSLADLAAERWASPYLDSDFGQMHARACRTLGGYEPDVPFRANDVAIMVTLVAELGVVAMLPALAAPRDDRVVVRELAEEGLARTIYAAYRKSGARRPAIRALVDALREAAA